MKYERGTTMWIEIQRTDAEQPFHVVFKAGNGHETFWCENLVTRANALRVIKKHAALFAAESGLDGPVAIVADWRHASGRGLRMHPAAVTTIEIRERDLRTEV